MRLFILLSIFLLIDCNASADDQQINVLGTALERCSTSPLTGFYRSGSCEWDGPHDFGVHSVCAQVTKEFLDYTRSRGNDLSTPVEASGFPGLKEGDRWCLCAGRWREALNANVAPPVLLRATHNISLSHVDINVLRKHALGNMKRRPITRKG